MRLLFIAPRLPWPADTGGKIRTFNVLKQLKGFAEVDLSCFFFEPDDESRAADLRTMLGVEVLGFPGRDPGPLTRVGRLFGPVPLSVAKYASRAMTVKIQSLIRSRVYDAVHIDHIHMASYAAAAGGLPCFIDEHNVEFRILERCARVEANVLKKIVYLQQSGRMRSFEAGALKTCASCGAVSEEDARLLKEMTGVPVHVVPNGVDTEFFSPPVARSPGSPASSNLPGYRDAGALETPAVVFTGSMDWLPNGDSVQYFIRDILPLVWEERPGLRFYVVGKNPAAAVTQIGRRDPRVVVTGRVDDVRPFLERAPIFVVPLRIGGGTRLKILEAMSFGRAVVSTSIGAEGIAATRGKDIVIADTPADFAHAVLSLMKDGERRKNIAAAGRALVLGQYDWNLIGRKLQSIYNGMVRHG